MRKLAGLLSRNTGGLFGSKATSGLWQSIVALRSPHATDIGSRLGGGTTMKRRYPALRNIGIGRNERALEKFQRDYPVELDLRRAYPESDHIKLLQRLTCLPRRVVLSGCPSVLCDQDLQAGAVSIRR